MPGNINAGKVFVELELRYSKMLAGMKSFTGSMVSGFKSAFTQIDSHIQKISNKISSMFSLGKMLVATALAGTASMMMKKVIDKGGAIADNSRKMTVSPEKYQFYDYAAGKSETDVGTVGIGIKQMLGMLDEAKTKGTAGAKTLDALGVSLKDLDGMTTDQKFDALAGAIAAIPDPADRANAAMAVFGSKSGLELLPMIEDLDKLKTDFEALNTMMSNEAVEAADKFGDQMLNLTTVLTNLIANSGMIKWLGDIVEGMNSVLAIGDKLGEKSGIGAPGSAGYRGGVSGFFSNMADAGAAGSGWNPLNWAGKGLHALGVGEQEGDVSLKATDTAADKKRLADAKKANIESGGKTLAERNADRVAAAAKAKADRALQAEEEKSAGALADMEEEAHLQDLINQGKERQAAIERTLYAQRKSLGRELTETETAKFTEAAGKLFDVEEAGKKKEIKDPAKDLQEKLRLQNLLNEGKDREVAIEEALSAAARATGQQLSEEKRAEVANLAGKLYDARQPVQKDKVETAGSFYANSMSLQSGGAVERTAKATEAIVKNTKDTNTLLKDGIVTFS